MKMSRAERKKRVKELIAKLDSMRVSYKIVGIDVYHYRASHINIETKFLAMIIFFILGMGGAVIGPVFFEEFGVPHTEPYFIAVIAISLCSAICYGYKHRDVLLSPNFWSVSYSSASVKLLEQAIADARSKMYEYQQEFQGLKPLILDLERLRPIIVDELGGEFELDKRAGKFTVYVKIDDLEINQKINKSTYLSVLHAVDDARDSDETIRQLKARIFGTTEEGS